MVQDMMMASIPDNPRYDDGIGKGTRMYPKRHIRNFAFFCGCSVTFLVIGIVIICFKTVIYKSVMHRMSMLQPGGFSFDMWKKNPVPLSLKMHLFNWTNAVDVHNSSVKPSFQELGPYFFDEIKEKVNITWNENNTVSFYHLKNWWFNPENSNGTLHDPVTSVDPIALSSAVTAKDWNYFVKKGLNVVLGTVGSKVYGTHSAGEILFDGYEDPLLTMANRMPSLGASSVPGYDKFGWFYTRNNSETFEGHFNMDTGVAGELGQIYSWKHMNHTPYNPGRCGDVSGSAGEFFPSDLTKDTIIKFFSPDLCRYAELEFEEEVVVDGLLGYRYVAGDRFLDNGSRIPDNKCFCIGDCQPYGTLDISACRFGSPAFVSLPHFYKADPHYASLVDGMKAERDKHAFSMIFEPKTGMPLSVTARLQVNLLLQPVSGIRLFESVPKVYVPIFWFEQSVVVPPDLILFITILANFEVICVGIGVFVILMSVVCELCYCYKLCNRNKVEKKLMRLREEEPLNMKKIERTYE